MFLIIWLKNMTVLDGLESYLMPSNPDMLTIEVICEKLNHRYEKNKNRSEKNKRKGICRLWMMMNLLKNLKAFYSVTVRLNHYDNAGEKEASNGCANRKGWV